MASSITGVLLMNVGTPDSPRTSDVRRYLEQFLGDGRVIDLSWRRVGFVESPERWMR